MLLSELAFGSYLTYTPKGNDKSAQMSRNVMFCLKSEKSVSDPPKFMSQYVVERLKNSIDKLPFQNFFGKNSFLVPVPKSSLMQSNTLWVPDKIAKCNIKQK